MKNEDIRRTMLFCPATNPKLYIDGPIFKPDCILFDLEDAVNYSEKDSARELLAEAIKSLDFGEVEIFARINPLYTEFGKLDVQRLVPAGLRKMRLPMSEKKEDIIELDELLTKIEQENGIEVGSCKIQASIETPLGVKNAYEIATASDRIISISFGAEDYTRLLGVDRTKNGAELFFARTQIANIASIVGVHAIDTVWADFNDVEGFEKETNLGKQLGFSGKSCIHPSQIERVHNIFTPTDDEIERSIIILEAVKKAGIEKGGVIQVNGKMVDIPVIEKAKKIINFAKGAGKIK